MNKSFSKIRHIEEANQRLEKRLLGEQLLGTLGRNKPTFSPIDFDLEIKNTKNDNSELTNESISTNTSTHSSSDA